MLSMAASRFCSEALMGPAALQKSTRITVPPGAHSRASCATNFLQGRLKERNKQQGLVIAMRGDDNGAAWCTQLCQLLYKLTPGRL
jgi:hypothetical protein